MLTRQQIRDGMPITAVGVSDIDATRYLTDTTTARSRVLSDDGAYVIAPALAWKGCTNVRVQATAVDVDLDVDLESVAQTALGTTDVVFADVSQGSINMCTSMAFVHAYTLRYILQGLPSPVPQLSPVYAYYFQRIEECLLFGVCSCCSIGTAKCDNTTSCTPPCLDCGSYLSSAATIFSRGVCTSAFWPTTTAIDAEPSNAAVSDAAAYRITAMACVPVGTGFVAALSDWLTKGIPVVVFLNLTHPQVTWMQAQQNAYNTREGAVYDVTLPDFVDQEGSAQAYVGHAVLVVGVTNTRILLRNNFGNAWGARGRFSISTKFASTAQFHVAVAVQTVVS